MKDTPQSILHRTNLKKTVGRLSIIEVLLKVNRPLTQQEISKKINSKMNYVSIYRCLEAFVNSGIVHKIECGDRVWRFALSDGNGGSHSHPHFTCKKCGETKCIDGISMPRKPYLENGYVIEEQELYFKGICPACSK